MQKTNLIKILLAGLFLLTAIFFAFFDNKIVFPFTLVAFLLTLTFLGGEKPSSYDKACASRWAVVIFSILVIVSNILVPLLLPVLLSEADFSGHGFEMTTAMGANTPQAMKEHFIEVTNNDMHELCYFTSLLLIINLISYLILVISAKRRVQSRET